MFRFLEGVLVGALLSYIGWATIREAVETVVMFVKGLF